MAKRKRKIFEDLRQALGDSLRYERGESVDLRVTDIPVPVKRLTPREIRSIRLSLNASQTVFAKLINVSANTVESWEQGVRRPRQAALKLLDIARRHPRVLLEH